MAMVSYFKPLFPAVTWRCQLCGREGANEEFITERVRGAMMRSEQGDFVFCKEHEHVAHEIVTKINDYRAQRQAALERDIEAELPGLVARWLSERAGIRPEEPETPTEQPGLKRRGRPPKNAMIPEPRVG